MVKKLSYVGAFIIFLFFVGFGLWRKQVIKESLSNGPMVTVTVQNVSCILGKEESKLYFMDRENQVKYIKVNHQDCYKYKKGDTITLMYNEKQDMYFIELETN